MHRIDGEDPAVFDWLSEGHDPELVDTFLEWLPLFAADPDAYEVAVKFRRGGVTCRVARVPDTHTYVDYMLTDPPPVIYLLWVRTGIAFNG